MILVHVAVGRYLNIAMAKTYESIQNSERI